MLVTDAPDRSAPPDREVERTSLAHGETTTSEIGIPGDAGGSPCLVLTAAPRPQDIGQLFSLNGHELVIGRSEDADLRVADAGASRRHARISPRPEGGYVLADLGSLNGTIVNGVRVRSALLAENDRIQIGSATSLRFSFRRELQASESLLRRALAAGGVGTWEWDARTCLLRLSDEGLRLVGCGAPIASAWEALDPDDGRRLALALEAAVGGAGPVHVEARVAGGAPRWLLLHGELFLEPSGAPGRVAGTVIEVTDRKTAELELRRQTRMIESLSDGVVVLDAAGHVADWNESARALFGWDRAEVMGRSPAELFGTTDGEPLHARIVAAVHRDGRWSGEAALRARGGARREVEIVAVPLADATGAVIGTILLHREVGERRALQARLALAERMSALGALASGMAHEINNPLAFVMGNVAFAREELLRAGAGQPPSPDRLAEIERALEEATTGADRIRTLVRDLRVFSHGGSDAGEARASIPAALEFALRVTASQVRHRARIVKDLADVPPVRLAESRLGQILMNLLSNAAHAIPPGDADRNEIRVSTRLAPGGRVALEVSDTGSGISPEHLSRIFDPFFTTKAVGEGTGLGLSICHALVTEAGGEIAVSSAPGAGTTFRVLLPPADPPAERPAAEPSAA